MAARAAPIVSGRPDDLHACRPPALEAAAGAGVLTKGEASSARGACSSKWR